MEKCENNSRQIPKTKEICSNKKYYDVLYSYLQYISEVEEKDGVKIRYVNRSDVNFTKLAEKFGLTRQTVSTRFKNLKEMGLIKERLDKNYEIIVLEKNYATLVPYETIELMVNSLSENAISTYVFLFNKYWKDQKPFQFALDEVKRHVGICATTRSNNNIITDILFVLQKIGLIKYHLTAMKQEGSSFDNIKTIYEVEWVTNKVER